MRRASGCECEKGSADRGAEGLSNEKKRMVEARGQDGTELIGGPERTVGVAKGGGKKQPATASVCQS